MIRVGTPEALQYVKSRLKDDALERRSLGTDGSCEPGRIDNSKKFEKGFTVDILGGLSVEVWTPLWLDAVERRSFSVHKVLFIDPLGISINMSRVHGDVYVDDPTTGLRFVCPPEGINYVDASKLACKKPGDMIMLVSHAANCCAAELYCGRRIDMWQPHTVIASGNSAASNPVLLTNDRRIVELFS